MLETITSSLYFTTTRPFITGMKGEENRVKNPRVGARWARTSWTECFRSAAIFSSVLGVSATKEERPFAAANPKSFPLSDRPTQGYLSAQLDMSVLFYKTQWVNPDTAEWTQSDEKCPCFTWCVGSQHLPAGSYTAYFRTTAVGVWLSVTPVLQLPPADNTTHTQMEFSIDDSCTNTYRRINA